MVKVITEVDGDYAICPYCGHKNGDCWEWLMGSIPRKYECGGCDQEFVAWADYSVSYVTKKVDDDQDQEATTATPAPAGPGPEPGGPPGTGSGTPGVAQEG